MSALMEAPGNGSATEHDGVISDHKLVAQVRRGDDRAFEALYQRYLRRIHVYVFGMVKDHQRAEDYDELASGQRCLRIQSIIATATSGRLGARDTRRLARHVAHCQPCRRQALAAGLDAAALRRPLRPPV